MNKQWYKSKTVWTAIVGAGLAVANAAGLTVPTFVFELLAALGLTTLRLAVK